MQRLITPNGLLILDAGNYIKGQMTIKTIIHKKQLEILTSPVLQGIVMNCIASPNPARLLSVLCTVIPILNWPGSRT